MGYWNCFMDPFGKSHWIREIYQEFIEWHETVAQYENQSRALFQEEEINLCNYEKEV